MVLVCVFVHMAAVDAMNETRRCCEEEFARAEGKKRCVGSKYLLAL